MTEVAKTESKELALAKKYGAIGAVENVGQNDVELKRLSLGQGTSDAVQEGKVAVGQYYGRQDYNVLGSNDEPGEFILFYMDKVWMEFDIEYNAKKDKEEKNFKQVLPLTPENASLPYRDEENNISRDLTYNFYLLSVKELEEGPAIPYIFSLSRVQTKSAKNINAKLSELAAAGLPSFAYVFEFTCESKQKGEGADMKKWAQVVARLGRETTEAEMEEAFRWLNIIKQKEVKVAGESKAGEGASDEAEKTTESGSGSEIDDSDDIPF